MLRFLIFILFIVNIYHANAFMHMGLENNDITCNDYIYKIQTSKEKFFPTIQDITKELGAGKTRTENSYTYHWKNLTVIFIDDKYLDHYGALNINNYSDLTPDSLKLVYGEPRRISQSTHDVIRWKCRYTLSNLEVITNEFNEVLRYLGRYCSRNNPDFCRNFDYTKKKSAD